ncbi:MAG: GNAT family N-acetyltransferase [Thomasclavelia sp.]|nr:GNAT family N-acetyltransferase [Thomasclavelia sp.]
MIEIKEIKQNKKDYLSLLLEADEQESMIDKYLEKGNMFVLDDNGIKGECVVLDLQNGTTELKNIAIDPKYHHHGYGTKLLEYIINKYQDTHSSILVGTGDSKLTIPFYEKSGFKYHHTLKNFFIDNYDHKMFEDGKQLIDMIYLSKELND